ncbi:nitroreductase/quinone reductase family protein [Nakamurella lactea]|uniref:nitroreductase/quinone reductase family protein n=1 Tax=Nakamurella lactea TaxID=459515 RepID=UPI0006887B07|nr:nitroreductase/quinone reductase family protein [Nakamurella lactea]
MPADRGPHGSAAPRIPVETVRFASYGRPWLIVLRGPRAMAFDRWLVRRAGFSLVSLQYALAGRHRYSPTLLLTTIGARSGALRQAALPYLERDGTLILVGSKGGGPTDPQWVRNLRRDGRCWVHIGRRQLPAIGHIADERERAELYDFVCQNKPNVPHYQQRADTFGRAIPFAVLSIRAGAGANEAADR